MKVYRSLKEVPNISNAAITIGTFDGVHIGHQKIISRLREIAKKKNGCSVLISFHPHPRSILNPGDPSVKLLTTIEERLKLLESYGLDMVVLIPFTREFSMLSAENFIADVLISKFKPASLVIGYDHRFGKDRKGDIKLLKTHSEIAGFTVEEISKQTLEDIGISSTKIRQALNAGDVESAYQLLGHYYSISGYVIKGKQIGLQIGFPTANVEVNSVNKLIPANGVYAVKVILDKVYFGMLNIGHRPTFNGDSKTIEVHILDFSKDIYGENIRIEFVSMLRQEGKFSGPEELKTQLEKDKTKVREILSSAQ